MPAGAIPIVHYQVIVAAFGKDIDALIPRGIHVRNRIRTSHPTRPRRKTLVGPMPAKAVPIIHYQVEIAPYAKSVDALMARAIHVRDSHWRDRDAGHSRRQTLVGPVPRRTVPVIDLQMVVVPYCEHVQP